MSARPTRAAARRRKEKTMNLYRITYGTPDSETETTNITERSETCYGRLLWDVRVRSPRSVSVFSPRFP